MERREDGNSSELTLHMGKIKGLCWNNQKWDINECTTSRWFASAGSKPTAPADKTLSNGSSLTQFCRQCQENLYHEVYTNFERDLGSPDLCKLFVGLSFIVQETFVLVCSVCCVPCLMNPFFHWVLLL